MELKIDDSLLQEAIDKAMKAKGYMPEDSIKGRTISIKEFAKKYCYPHSSEWVKVNIFYKFKPDWVADLTPGKGRAFTIFEYPASLWMEKHRKDIDWNATI